MHLEYRFLRGLRFVVEAGVGSTLCWALFMGVQLNRMVDAGKIAVPIIAIYIACASLFYNRSRALPKGSSKTRSLYAAERALQATLFSVFGVVIGVVYYAFLHYVGYGMTKFGYVLTSLGEVCTIAGWLIPAGYVIFGYMSFIFAIRAASKDLMRPTTAIELARRIRNAP